MHQISGYNLMLVSALTFVLNCIIFLGFHAYQVNEQRHAKGLAVFFFCRLKGQRYSFYAYFQ